MTVVFNDNANDPSNTGADRFSDGSDAYANGKQLFLSIFHVASGLEVNFKAFITQYNENFSTEYTPEKVFGRFDPIMTFSNTTRTIGSVSWELPAFSLQEAKANLARCNRLAQFMYPAYLNRYQANTLARPPLMRIRFANLIRNSAAGDSPYASVSGLLVAVGGLTITPDFAADGPGFFDPGGSTLYPKSIRLDLTGITVLHEHQIGWGPEIGFNSDEFSNYPFGKTEGVFAEPSAATATNQANQQVTAERPPEGISEESFIISNDGDELNLAADSLSPLDPIQTMELGTMESDVFESYLEEGLTIDDALDATRGS